MARTPALRLVDALELPRYHLFHAVRADFLRRLGRRAEPRPRIRAAIEYCGNAREKDFLQRQYDAIAWN